MTRLTSIRSTLGVADTRTARPAMDRTDNRSAWARGYDGAWRKLRLQVLAEEPLCRFCREAGRVTAATDVDHIKTIAEAPDLRLVRSNLRPLCRPCHSAHTATEQGGQGPAAR